MAKKNKIPTLKNLVRVRCNCGIIGGKPVAKIIETDIKELAKDKWLFYLQNGMPEVADAYQRDFNLTDKETWGRIDAKTDKIVKKGGWFNADNKKGS